MNQFIRISSILLLAFAIPTPSQAFDADAETSSYRDRDFEEFPDIHLIREDQIFLSGDGTAEVVGDSSSYIILKRESPEFKQTTFDFYNWAVGKFIARNDLDATKPSFIITDQFTADDNSLFGPNVSSAQPPADEISIQATVHEILPRAYVVNDNQFSLIKYDD
jgi:hypothetical protein